MNIFEICSKITSETNKYNKHSHELYRSNETEIYKYTKNLVPEKFSTSQRISYIIELESDPSMKTRYFMECPCCKQQFHRTKGLNSITCTPCRKQGYNICEKHNQVYLRSCLKCLIENSHKKYTQDNKKDWIECQICGFRGGDLNSHIIKIHNMKTNDYREQFNIQSIKCQALCDVIAGENNPGYQHGGKFSPFSEKFLYADKTDTQKIKEKAAKNRADNDGNTTSIGYWLKKTNNDVERAEQLLSQRQSTFSLKKCIEEYGEEKGFDRWKTRQETWHKNYKKSNFSKISQKLFWDVIETLGSLENIYFAELDKNKQKDFSRINNELRLTLDSVILPDFIDTAQKKVIEFDGVYWHGEIGHGNIQRENLRDNMLIKYGYKVLHINENDYIKNKQQTIELCRKFLIQ
jgi:very-short-patch-repair endonuclease